MLAGCDSSDCDGRVSELSVACRAGQMAKSLMRRRQALPQLTPQAVETDRRGQ